MNKKQRFNISQSAHLRLINKYPNTDKETNWVIRNYHNACIEKQRTLKRILTRDERNTIYRNTEYYYKNFKR